MNTASLVPGFFPKLGFFADFLYISGRKEQRRGNTMPLLYESKKMGARSAAKTHYCIVQKSNLFGKGGRKGEWRRKEGVR
jgi:hypothetical protein